MGSITFFTGPMFSGKSEQLISRLKKFRVRHLPVVCLQPTRDTRTPAVQSRNGLAHESVRVEPHDLAAIRQAVGDARAIGIDEFHFFPPTVVPLLVELMRQGRVVLVAGLDTDFRAVAYDVAAELMKIPEVEVVRTRAICEVCRQENATRSQRLVGGAPASADQPVLIVEGAVANITYEPRCLEHHVSGAA